jgi:hypothetical protein
MRSRVSSYVGIGIAVGFTSAALWCASCSLTTSLDGLTNGAGGDAAMTSGNEAGAADGNVTGEAATADVSAGEGGSPASAYRAAVLADAPLAYWRLGEAAGAKTAKDETGNGHDGAVAPEVVLGVGGGLGGDTNTAARFNGAAGNIAIGDIFRFDGVTSFTLEAWIRPTAPGGYGTVLGRDSDPNGYALFLTPSLGAGFERQRSGNDDFLTGPLVSTSSFTHLVATYDGSAMRLYVNGTLVQGPMVSTSIPGASSSFFIGADTTGAADLFKGDIDEPAVYDHALSDAQILTHFTIGKGL